MIGKQIEVMDGSGTVLKAVRGYSTPVPELWLTRDLNDPSDANKIGWTVTHVPTGKAVVRRLGTRAEALEFVQQIEAHGFDWRLDDRGLVRGDMIKMRETRDKIMAYMGGTV